MARMRATAFFPPPRYGPNRGKHEATLDITDIEMHGLVLGEAMQSALREDSGWQRAAWREERLRRNEDPREPGRLCLSTRQLLRNQTYPKPGVLRINLSRMKILDGHQEAQAEAIDLSMPNAIGLIVLTTVLEADGTFSDDLEALVAISVDGSHPADGDPERFAYGTVFRSPVSNEPPWQLSP